jgi:hypothetical protein
MVPFCNRTLVFLLKSGYRYRTGFRFKISTGEPDGGGRYMGGHRARLPGGTTQIHLDSLPPSGRSVTYPIRCQFILFGKCKHLYDTTSNPISHTISNPISYSIKFQSLTILNPISHTISKSFYHHSQSNLSPFSIQSFTPISHHSQSNLSHQSLTILNPNSHTILSPFSIQTLTPHPHHSITILNPISHTTSNPISHHSQSKLSHHIQSILTPHPIHSHTTSNPFSHHIQSILTPHPIQYLSIHQVPISLNPSSSNLSIHQVPISLNPSSSNISQSIKFQSLTILNSISYSNLSNIPFHPNVPMSQSRKQLPITHDIIHH